MKVIKKLAKITSKEDGREISYIRSEGLNFIATNKYILAEITHNMPGINSGFISKENSKKMDNFTFEDVDLYNNLIKEDKDLKYPDYKKLLSDEEPMAKIKLNASYLKQLLDICDKDEEIELNFYNEKQPLKITGTNKRLLISSITN